MMMGKDLAITVLGNSHLSFHSINTCLSRYILEEEIGSWVIKTHKVNNYIEMKSMIGEHREGREMRATLYKDALYF